MDTTNKEGLTIQTILFLCVAVAVYSLSGVFTKLASGYDFISLPYIASLVGAVFVLGIYAILWQKALKNTSLSQAYPFRSLGLVYSLIIAHFIFCESISWQNILGSIIIILGLLILTVD